MVAKQTIYVGGIEVHVFSSSEIPLSGHGEDSGLVRKDVVAFFFLHGRNGSAEVIEPVARSMVERCEAKERERGRELLVITFVSDRLRPQGCIADIPLFHYLFWSLMNVLRINAIMERGLWTPRPMKDGPKTQKRIMSTMRSCLLRSLHYGSGNSGRCRVDMFAIQGRHG